MKVKINKSNKNNEALSLIRDRQSASMALRSCYPLKQFLLKYIEEYREYLGFFRNLKSKI
ncbi:hypothetical protein D0A37_01110 [Microcoleus vaginatus HSN003]|nr:hypothetical protein D0A37_01110 [Microcoleus vaginatus HSN003]